MIWVIFSNLGFERYFFDDSMQMLNHADPSSSTLNAQVATLKNSLIDLSLIDRQDVMNSILHCSDISGPGKMWNIHETWTLLLMQEFFAQVSVTSLFGS